MPLRFINFLFFFIFLFNHLNFSLEKKINLTILTQTEITSPNSKYLSSLFLTRLEEYLLKEEKIELFLLQDIIENEIKGSILDFHIKKVSNYLFSKNIFAFYLVKLNEEGEQLNISLFIYSTFGSVKYENELQIKLASLEREENFYLEKWEEIIKESIDVILKVKSERTFTQTQFRIKEKRDFPFVEISVSIISAKLYLDKRTYEYYNKIFTISPIDIRITFFPFKYFETGLFCQFDVNNYIYYYYKSSEKRIFPSYFNFLYGIHAGLSFFIKKDTHYSFGISFYNIYTDISLLNKWLRKDAFINNFLPQFSIYQKIDFKIYKFLYFTVLFNLKTSPLFFNEDNYFFSKSFCYDFIFLELSLIGISLFF